MSDSPSIEIRKSERYHELADRLCRNYCYRNNGMWTLPKEKIGEIPQEEWDVLFKYPPITEITIHPKQPKQSHKHLNFGDA